MNETKLKAKPLFELDELKHLIQHNQDSWYVIEDPHTKRRGVIAGAISLNEVIATWPLVAIFPPFLPTYLGDVHFLKTHHATYPYIVGEMANGIATAEMVIHAARAGLVSFFGAAGLVPQVVEKNILHIQEELKNQADCWGSNLIHSPNEPTIEEAVVACYLKHGVRRVSASAYMQLSHHIVHYAFKGIRLLPDGSIKRCNYVLAKLSRPEVAQFFMEPPPREILSQLVKEGKLTADEAQLASKLPVAEDITVEADSGGHTDNRPAIGLFPLIKAMAERMNATHHYATPIRVGLGGGIGTPEALAAAFSMGAAYVLTGTINQTAIESGLSKEGKSMLTKAELADVMMAAAADMFEMGVKLQVLKRGSLFASRANQLYQIYKSYASLDAIPSEIKMTLEKEIFRQPFDVIWQGTRNYFLERDRRQVDKAEVDAKYKMALVFRWYLGQSSRWAIRGEMDRQSDFQIWCGPCIGAFNDWIRGSYLEKLEDRGVVDIAMNLLYSAVQLMRASQLREVGVILPQTGYRPEIKRYA